MALKIYTTSDGQIITTGSGEADNKYFKALNAVLAELGQPQVGAEVYYGHLDELVTS